VARATTERRSHKVIGVLHALCQAVQHLHGRHVGLGRLSQNVQGDRSIHPANTQEMMMMMMMTMMMMMMTRMTMMMMMMMMMMMNDDDTDDANDDGDDNNEDDKSKGYIEGCFFSKTITKFHWPIPAHSEPELSTPP
jgi:hypothetical protein